MTANMNARRSRCPGPRQLSQAFSTGVSAAMREHLEGCEGCARDWRAYEQLRELGSELPDGAPDGARAEQQRTSLVAAVRTQRRRANQPRRSWRAVMGVATAGAAVAAGVALWVALAGSGSATRTSSAAAGERRATVQASQGAHFVHSSESEAGTSDEVVRLSRGRITVAVEHLASGERFRVVTGNAEIEVRGTAFDVDVVDDKLVEVAVHSGLVEVRLPDRAPLLLAAGERWHARVAVAEVNDPSVAADVEQDAVGGEATIDGHRAVAEPAVAVETRPHAVTTPGRAPGARNSHRRPARVAAEPADAGAAAEPVAVAAAAAADDAPDSDAEAGADEVLPARPTPSEAAFQAGWQALKSANYGEAAAAFARVIAMAPAAPLAEDARYWEAVALARAGRDEVARRAMATFLDRHARSARAGEVSVMLGWLLLEAGESTAARARFQAATSDRQRKVRDSARAGLAAIDGKTR